MRVYTFSYQANGGRPPADLRADKVVDCRVLAEPWVPFPRARRLFNDAVMYGWEHPGAVIAFGCDYGQMRSVAMAEEFARRMGCPVTHTAEAVA
jgi:RNase adaptor protein for sRNA GlmZ degradation